LSCSDFVGLKPEENPAFLGFEGLEPQLKRVGDGCFQYGFTTIAISRRGERVTFYCFHVVERYDKRRWRGEYLKAIERRLRRLGMGDLEVLEVLDEVLRRLER